MVQALALDALVLSNYGLACEVLHLIAWFHLGLQLGEVTGCLES